MEILMVSTTLNNLSCPPGKSLTRENVQATQFSSCAPCKYKHDIGFLGVISALAEEPVLARDNIRSIP
ncbi:unnamed protein product, partial [Dovyalis caffra]